MSEREEALRLVRDYLARYGDSETECPVCAEYSNEKFWMLARALLALAADLEAAKRELRFILLGLEPAEHRDAMAAGKACPWVTPDCMWCNIRRVLRSLDGEGT